jgi:hypothetical protein
VRNHIAIPALLLPVAALLASCSPDSVTAPTPCDGPSTFACGAWSPCRPEAASATFDLDVTPGAIEAIRRAGGTIVHEYNVSKVRAVLPVDAVPGLASARMVCAAFQVSPESGFDFRGLIGIPTPLTPDDREFLAAAGVTSIREYSFIDAIAATIPDAAVPIIRDRPGVRVVEIDGIICIDGGIGPAR